MAETTKRKRPTDWMRANQNAEVVLDGRQQTIRAGETLARRSDPMVQQFGEFFEEAEVDRPVVEEATARMGEERGPAAA